jgi:hypothetical protein
MALEITDEAILDDTGDAVVTKQDAGDLWGLYTQAAALTGEDLETLALVFEVNRECAPDYREPEYISHLRDIQGSVNAALYMLTGESD